MFTKILLATDGSDCAQKATVVAAQLAKRVGADLTVLHVFRPPIDVMAPYAAAGVTGELDPGLLSRWAEDAARWVSERTDCALRTIEPDGDGVVPSRPTFRSEIGDPTECIVRIARDETFDLIVVGSRGLSGFKELLLGSVSNFVNHHAPCPVLIVH